jgi:hypothetical protein
MIVRFVEIDGIDDHHCLNFLFIKTRYFIQSITKCKNAQSKEKVEWWRHINYLINSGGHQFHQFQQNEQSSLILTELTEHKNPMTYDVGNPIPDLVHAHKLVEETCGDTDSHNRLDLIQRLIPTLNVCYGYLIVNFWL